MKLTQQGREVSVSETSESVSRGAAGNTACKLYLKSVEVLPSFGVNVGAAENLEEDEVKDLHIHARY